MYRIHMLPARRGDSLWIEYGDPDDRHHVLIDGGVGATQDAIRHRIESLELARPHLDLLVVSHIDLDHIEGLLELLREPPAGLTIGDVWFNGWKHLPEDPGIMGAKQAESFSARLEQHGYPWNTKFGGKAVALSSDPDAPLPTRTLEGGMEITLLGPTPERLSRLRSAWKREVEAAGLVPGKAGALLEGLDDSETGIMGAAVDLRDLAASPFKKDTSRANGSSIALVASYGGKRCLFAGDAFADDMVVAAKKLADTEGETELALDAVKLSHHGGKKNTSAELVRTLACRNYLVSTDGSYYEHPQVESLSRVVVHGDRRGQPRLFFNYESDQSALWKEAAMRRQARYETHYPNSGEQGLAVDL